MCFMGLQSHFGSLSLAYGMRQTPKKLLYKLFLLLKIDRFFFSVNVELTNYATERFEFWSRNLFYFLKKVPIVFLLHFIMLNY